MGMFEFSAEYLIIILFGIVIVFLLAIIYLMQCRIRTIRSDVEGINNTMHFTCNKLDALSKDVEEFNKQNR